jgi:hypothetical protein
MNPVPSESDVNSYINDPESGAEMLRLLDQDRTLTSRHGRVAARTWQRPRGNA